MPESNERSAEYWRGALYGYHGSEFLRYEDIHAQIADAEAREGGENAAEISADRAWIDGAKFGWNCDTKTELHEAIANRQLQIRECSVVDRINAAVKSVQPTPAQPSAADVIVAAEKALETGVCYLRIYRNENKHLDSWVGSEDEATLLTDEEELARSLALIARWKEANGGK